MQPSVIIKFGPFRGFSFRRLAGRSVPESESPILAFGTRVGSFPFAKTLSPRGRPNEIRGTIAAYTLLCEQ